MRFVPIPLQMKTLHLKWSVKVMYTGLVFIFVTRWIYTAEWFLIRTAVASLPLPLYINTTTLCLLFTLGCKTLLCFGVGRLEGEMEVTQFPEVSQH